LFNCTRERIDVTKKSLEKIKKLIRFLYFLVRFFIRQSRAFAVDFSLLIHKKAQKLCIFPDGGSVYQIRAEIMLRPHAGRNVEQNNTYVHGREGIVPMTYGRRLYIAKHPAIIHALMAYRKRWVVKYRQH